MRRIETSLPGVCLLEPQVWKDERGLFFESYHQLNVQQVGIDDDFVQDNISHSTKGVLRGLHYQMIKPQAKLVSCVHGTIFDVVVDVRRESPTFGQWYSCELSGENHFMLYIPMGFAHGFYTLSEQAKVHYKCSEYYYQQGEQGIIWNDPDLAIKWPLITPHPIISKKDLASRQLSQMDPEDLPQHKA